MNHAGPMHPRLPPITVLALFRALRKRRGSESAASFQTAYRLDRVNRSHIERYNAALGFGAGELPVTYYYLITQRAHLATLNGERFPFRVAGMVHVENDLVEHAEPALNEGIDITTIVQIEPPTGTGARYCLLETVAEQGGKKIFTCRSRYLARRGQRKSGAASRSDDVRHAVIGTWQLGPASGREYAAISGDWNPIHLWKWSARLMGFESPIIHGMHTLAKACAAIESHTGKRIQAVCARFKAPIPLGEQASGALSADDREFSVLCHDRVSVQGTLGFAPAEPSSPKQ